MTTLGARFRKALRHAGKTQKDVAAHLDVAESSVSQWANDTTKNIRNEHLFQLAQFLGVEARWLGEGKGPMTSLETQTLAEISPKDREAIELARQIVNLSPKSRTALKQFLDSVANG